MRKSDVCLGHTYLVKVGGHFVPVRLDLLSAAGSGWHGTNLKTGREIRIVSAGRLRKELTPQQASVVLALKN